MIQNYSKQFVVWVTRLKHRILTDIFTSAQVRLTLLYLLIGAIILAVIGFWIDHVTRETFARVMASSTDANRAIDYSLYQQLGKDIWSIRVVELFLLVTVAYFLSALTLRPAKRAHLSQRRFIANVSHELRTPLSILKTSSEVALLRGKDISREELMELLQSNIEEVDRMSKIIQFFLNFSASQNKIDRVQMSLVNLSQIASKAINILQKKAGEKGVRLALLDKSTAVIYGNVTALEEMLLNLIKNAITYSPKKTGLVEVTIKHTVGEVLLSIHDNGLGIPAEDIPHIFEPFFRASNTVSKKEGVGLGLAIVREIAIMHRAVVNVKSKVGKGTTFTVHFRKH